MESNFIFSGLLIAYTPGLTISAPELSKIVTKNGGKISFTTSSSVTHVIASQREINSTKANYARKNGKFLVTEKVCFLHFFISSNYFLEHFLFEVILI